MSGRLCKGQQPHGHALTPFFFGATHGWGAVLAVSAIFASPVFSAPFLQIESSNFPLGTSLKSGEEIRIRLNRLPTLEEGKLAVFIGQTDITSLITIEANEIRYQPSILALATGETEVTIYLVRTSTNWEKIAQLSLTIQDVLPTPSPTVSPGQTTAPTPQPEASLTPASPTPTTTGDPLSTTRLEMTPNLDLNLKHRFRESRTLDAGPAEREVFYDLTAHGRLAVAYDHPDLKLQANFNLLGATSPSDRLQFAELGEGSPGLDLSDYLIELESGRLKFSLGHVCFGGHLYLLDAYCSRGLIVRYQISDGLDLAFNTMNGRSIVGFSNFLGLQSFKNNITALTVGAELIPSQPGNLRIEATYLQGRLQPFPSFNVGEVLDSEETTGWGVKLLSSLYSERLKTDIGFARTAYNNPAEQQFLNELSVQPTQGTTSNAYYAEVAYDILKEETVFVDKKMSLTLKARQDHVDPQYQSLGVVGVTNQRINTFSLSSDISGSILQLSYITSEDNLDNLPTLLTTKTQNTTFDMAIPFKSLFSSTEDLIPNFTYQFNRVLQFGANRPTEEDGGFRLLEQIPDQLSTSQNMGLIWSGKNWNLGYQVSHSLQDNRQLTREIADFKNLTHTVTFDWQPSESLSLNLGLGWSKAEDQEQSLTTLIQNQSLTLNWHLSSEWSLSSSLSLTDQSDSGGQFTSQGYTLDSQLQYQFQIPLSETRQLPGSLFVRYAANSTVSRDLGSPFPSEIGVWTLDSGLSLSF